MLKTSFFATDAKSHSKKCYGLKNRRPWTHKTLTRAGTILSICEVYYPYDKEDASISKHRNEVTESTFVAEIKRIKRHPTSINLGRHEHIDFELVLSISI